MKLFLILSIFVICAAELRVLWRCETITAHPPRCEKFTQFHRLNLRIAISPEIIYERKEDCEKNCLYWASKHGWTVTLTKKH
ncbi:unnamed protein product [Cylicocyclus nassatus]|uniref:Uncharacterized protein n=1 Tax=Cylicocyclus nassatus TaxID=53992 RepID=A0AA36M6S0_CYLNA|nr:unnamed protein product [Cylicocyclus nassatus]